jgi:site-specific DNA-methyltransferase (adenine-specific)
MNKLAKSGTKHSSAVETVNIKTMYHAIYIQDAVKFLKTLPDNSIQLILIDPPYNLDLEYWDSFPDYLVWAKQWIDQIYRVLTESGNCVIFGGFQFQDLKQGDLLEILHYARHNTKLRLVNIVIWYYKNGMSAHRYFANRHEEAIWLSKTKKYYFDLDAVRIPYDEEAKIAALKDKRLIPENIEKGKNPTNVWEIGRLNGNSTERVGHPTQKPTELIRRFVKALSYEGSLVLDFFAGSGTTGRVCIEENRHSIMVDADPSLIEYFKKHVPKMDLTSAKPYEIFDNVEINEFLEKVNNKIDNKK